MIQAIIFDLDGTLVQTEKLKALSYAKAAVALSPYSLGESEVIEAFKDVVGRSRREVALAAGMNVVAVSTPFTKHRLHESRLLPPELIVDDPQRAAAVVAWVISQHA